MVEKKFTDKKTKTLAKSSNGELKTEIPEKNISKGVSLPPNQWILLKRVSRAREDRGEARYAISAIIQDLIKEAESRLKKEIVN